MSKRVPIVAGNWKMNKTATQARAFAIQLRERIRNVTDREIIVFPPFTALPVVADELRNSNIRFGGQNMHWERSGAFTGEVSADFLSDLGCTHVLVGHSERRRDFGEDDDTCSRKVRTALDAGLIPLFCCGETLEQRNAEQTSDVVKHQLSIGLDSVKDEEFIIAYEPVWAIGTGKTATSTQAEEVHRWIREWLGKRFGPAVAETVRILYGGSVKPNNINELMAEPDIDGALVGGAGLDLASFEPIVRFK